MTSLCRMMMLSPFLLVVGLAGCQAEPEITEHKQPRATSLQRTLGALIYRDDATWTFKLSGKEVPVSENVAAFDQMVRSVRFDSKGEPTWQMPAGWGRDDKQPDGEMIKRYATMQLGPKDKQLECMVHQLPAKAGTVYANVNRWRAQVGLYPLGEGDLTDFVREENIAGQVVYFTDMVGPGAAPGAGKGPMQMRRPDAGGPPPDAGAPKLKYEAPKNWKPASAQFSLATWDIDDGPKKARVSVSQVGGSLMENVNRWRVQQLQLPGWTMADYEREARPIQIGGVPSKIVEFVNPQAKTPTSAIIAVIVPMQPQNMYILLRGPADTVAEHKAAFEGFLKTIKLEEK